MELEAPRPVPEPITYFAGNAPSPATCDHTSHSTDILNISVSESGPHIDRVIAYEPFIHHQNCESYSDLEVSPPAAHSDCHDLTVISSSVIRDRLDTWPSPTHSALEKFPILKIYDAVRKSGVPNMLSARIPVPSQLRLDVWNSHATGHSDDRFVLDGINYGFPLQYVGPKLVVRNPDRHASDFDDHTHILDYLWSETQNNALIGPFHSSPFKEWLFTAPLMTRPKDQPNKRRIIVDLSYPPEANVNMYIHKNSIFGTIHHHNLPSVNDLVNAARAREFHCVIGIIDIQRAYRNIPNCPMDFPLLGIKYDGSVYIDSAMPFGARISSLNMQKVAQFIVRALAKMSIQAFMFLDDLAVVLNPQDDPHAKFSLVMNFLRSLGLPIAYAKLQPPAARVKYLGIVIDIPAREISIPSPKIDEFLHITRYMLNQPFVTTKQLQSFVGRVNYLAKAVQPARLFMSRALQSLRDSYQSPTIQVSAHLKADLKWFNKFLMAYNGRSLLKPQTASKRILADSCLTAGGATDFHSYYEFVYPPKVAAAYHISVLEALNCLIALRLFLTDADNHTTVQLYCDNSATVQILTTGRARDPVMAAIARAVWYIIASRDIYLIATHVPGQDMFIPDALSRAHTSAAYRLAADRIIEDLSLVRIVPSLHVLNFRNYL